MSVFITLVDIWNACLVACIETLIWLYKSSKAVIKWGYQRLFSSLIEQLVSLLGFILKPVIRIISSLFRVLVLPIIRVVIKAVSQCGRFLFSSDSAKNSVLKLVLVLLWISVKPFVIVAKYVIHYVVIPLAHYIIQILAIKTVNDLALLTLNPPSHKSLWGFSPDTNQSSSFVSWEMLTNRVYNARTLNPKASEREDLDRLANLFIRDKGVKERKDEHTSVLFPFFARWLTDSFMRINPSDRRKNSSNHELDLCQVYGLTAKETEKLRAYHGGRLRSRMLDIKRNNEGVVVKEVIWDDDLAEECFHEGDAYRDRKESRKRKIHASHGVSQPVYEEFLPLLFEPIQGGKVSKGTKVDDYSASKYIYQADKDRTNDGGSSDSDGVETVYRVKSRYEYLVDRYIELSEKPGSSHEEVLSPNDKLNRYLLDLFRFVDKSRQQDVDTMIGNMYATGLERGNASVGYTMFSTLFLREHNRICDQLVSSGFCAESEDEKLFQTARMITTIIYLKIIIQSYINHIGAKPVTWGFYPDKVSRPGRFNIGRIKQQWYKPNWVSLEFNLLYRWHAFVPTYFQLGGNTKLLNYFFHNNKALEDEGLGECYKAASLQYANKLTLKNTPFYLREAEEASLKMGHDYNLAPFMDYQKFFKAEHQPKSLKAFCGEELAEELRACYGSELDEKVLAKMDFYVGLFAEKKHENKPFGEMIYRMVASDAFTHLYRNPLLSPEVFNENVLGKEGIKIINDTQYLEDLLLRNSSDKHAVANFSVD